MFLRLLKSFCIFARHGVNPFQPASDNAEKVQKRFTEKEKQWYMGNAKTRSGREYIRKILYGDNPG